MASSRFIAEDIVDALFDDGFGLSDEDNTEYEDNRIYGYLGSPFFRRCGDPTRRQRTKHW